MNALDVADTDITCARFKNTIEYDLGEIYGVMCWLRGRAACAALPDTRTHDTVTASVGFSAPTLLPRQSTYDFCSRHPRRMTLLGPE